MTDNQTENENGLKKQIACIRWHDIKKCTLLEISYEIYFVGIHTVQNAHAHTPISMFACLCICTDKQRHMEKQNQANIDSIS